MTKRVRGEVLRMCEMCEFEEPWLTLTATEIESKFIDDHWQYASLIHQVSADALVTALGAGATESPVGHTLFARLFGEFAACLESFAAWCFALRERTEPGSFLDSYVGYQNSDIGGLYTLVRDHAGDPIELLRLPAVTVVVDAVVARHADAPDDDDVPAPADYEGALRALGERLREAADLYFGNDRTIIDTYNKTKHGAPMLRIFEPENPRVFEIVMRNRRAGEEGEPPYQFASFTVTGEMIGRLRRNVGALTLSLRDLASLTKLLLDARLLYPVPVH